MEKLKKLKNKNKLRGKNCQKRCNRELQAFKLNTNKKAIKKCKKQDKIKCKIILK